MTTTSTVGIYTTICSNIQNFVPKGATASLSASFNGLPLFVVQAPDNQSNTNTANYPYCTIRLMNGQSNPEYNGDRKDVDLEIMLYDRPRNNQIRAETIADGIDQAMLRYRSMDSTGIMFSRYGQRDTILAAGSPADRELVSIRLVYPLSIWAQYMTQYSGSL